MSDPTFQEYQPEMWTVCKDDVYAAIAAIESGIEYTRAALLDHDSNLGRDHPKNKLWAEQMERDVESMKATMERLRKYSAFTMPA